MLFCLPDGLSFSDFLKIAALIAPLAVAPMLIIESKYWFSKTVFTHKMPYKASARNIPSLSRTLILPVENMFLAAAALSTCFNIRAINKEGRNWTNVFKSLSDPDCSKGTLNLKINAM